MSGLDLDNSTNSLTGIDDDTLRTVIILIPTVTVDNFSELSRYKTIAYERVIKFLGLGHLDADGCKNDEVTVLASDHVIPIEDLKEVESICKEYDIYPLSFVIKNSDLDNIKYCFLGTVQ